MGYSNVDEARLAELQSLLDKNKITSKKKKGFQSFISDYAPIKEENRIESNTIESVQRPNSDLHRTNQEKQKEYNRLMSLDINAAKQKYDDSEKKLEALQNELNFATNPEFTIKRRMIVGPLRSESDIAGDIEATKAQSKQYLQDYNDAKWIADSRMTDDELNQAIADAMKAKDNDAEMYYRSILNSRSQAKDDKSTSGKVLDLIGNSAYQGLTGWNKGITSTVDVLLGKPLQAIGWEDNPISSVANYFDRQHKLQQLETEASKNALGGGTGVQVASQLTESTVAALPDAILALMTSGTSLGGKASTTAAYESANLLGKAGITAQTMARNPQYWMSFARELGSDYEEAVDSGASEYVAGLVSTVTALINAGVEIGSDGMSGIQGVPEAVKNGDKSAIRIWVEGMVEEGNEEVIQGLISRTIANATYNDAPLSSIGTGEGVIDPATMAQEWGMGAAVGGLLGGGQIALSNSKAKVFNTAADSKTAGNVFTDSEQAVLDKVYEKAVADREADGSKLTDKEKSKLYDSIVDQMEKGGIDIDTIESTLGGDAYKAYKVTIDSEEKLKKELNKLSNTETGKLTRNQLKRLEQLESMNLDDTTKRDSLRKQLDDTLSPLLENSRLAESYNQAERRKQAFEADLTQYKGKQRAAVERAINSGVLNNAYRSHELVDILSKIEADKGITFDYTNNAKLKESGFALEGKRVNGFTKGDSVTLNVQSSKAWQSVVGHEITHVLEGTDAYTELRNALYKYAESKGELESRKSSLAELYKDMDADIDAELTADLVGDYLFADKAFINHLTENRTLFHKIYDEIKYLFKVATGKEKADIEKVKREFDKAWKEVSGKGVDGKVKYSTQYSISYTTDNNPVVVVEDNILEGVPKNKWIETVKNTISEKFSNGIPVRGRLIKVNSVTRNEYANSKNTRYLRASDGSVYADKFKSANNLDEIVLASTNYINEDLKHERKDNIKEFARGDVLLRVGNNDYSAKVIVGFTGGKEMVLYDIINFTPTELSIKKERTHQGYAQAGSPRKDVSSVDTILSQEPNGVNTIISENAENDTEKAKYSLSDSNDVPLEQRVSGDNLLDAQDLIDTVKDVGAKVDGNGYITVYHRTNNQSKEKILSSGQMTAKEDGIFFSTKKDGQNAGYGSEIIEFKIPAEKLMLDDIFDDEAHLRLPLKRAGEIIDVSQYLNKDTGKAKYSLSDSDQDQQSDLNLLFDDDFYEQFKYEDKTKISKSIEELEKIKASDDFDNMSFEDAYKVNTDLKALKAGYDNQYDYIVGREKQRLAKEYERGSSTVMSMIDKKKKQIAKQEQLSRDISESTPFKNAQFEIIQKSNPMWDDYHTGIRSPKDIKTFSEVIDDGESFTWGDFSKEDAERALKRGTVRVYSSYPIKNGIFVSTSYQQALDYAGGEPSGVHSRVVALDSVAWINGDEGQYAKVYNLNSKNDTGKPQFSLSENGEQPSAVGTPLQDLYYEAPVREDIAPTQDIAENATTTDSNFDAPLPNDVPVTTEEANAVQDKKAKSDNEQNDKIAQVLTETPEQGKKKGRIISKVRSNFIDKGSAVEDLALKTKNRALQDKYKTIGRSEAKAQYFMENGADGVKSLKDIRQEVEQSGKVKEFFTYLYHKHNVDRMSLESKEAPNLARLTEKMQEYQLLDLKENQLRAIAMENVSKDNPKRAELVQTVRDYLVSTEIKNKPVFGDSVTAEASQETANQLEKQYPQFKQYANDVYSYMNHLRDMMVENGIISKETAELWAKMYPSYVPIGRYGKNGLAVNVPLDTNRTGVNAPIKGAKGGNSDILPLFDTMAQRTIQTFKAIDKNNFGIELKNTLGSAFEASQAKLDDVIDTIDTQDGLLQEGKNGKNPTFTVFEDGKRVTFDITDDLYDAMKPTSEGLSYTNKVLNKASSLHKKVLTEYNLFFTARNALKDAQDVLINSQHPAKTYANLTQAFIELLTGKGEYVNEYWENGGKQNTYFDKSTNTFAEEKSKFKKIVGFPLEGISKANDFVEAMPRLAEYIASRKKGATVEAAMLDAARVTTDFSAGGDVTKFLNRNGATFLNASVQGAAQQVRNIREAKANGLKGILKLAGKYALAGLPALLLNSLIWGDDEEYDELSDYVKDNYYIVGKCGDGQFVRIPKGRTLSVIQELFEQIGKTATGEETDWGNVFTLAASNLAPNNPLDNNVIAPIIQAATNKTWYGEDLVPKRLQDVPASEQYDETIDSISKWLGENTGISPYKINYVLNQYTGFIGDMFIPALTPEAERGNDSFAGNLIAPLTDQFTVDKTIKNQNTSDFFSKADELKVNANSQSATDEDILKSKYMNAVNSEMSDLYKQKREIQNLPLRDSTKYAQVRSIQEKINELAKNALNTYNNVSIDNGYATVGDKHYRLENGVWTKISDKQLERQQEVTSELGISPSEYWSKTEISYFPNIDGEYEYAYDNPEKYAVAKAVGGYEAYKSYKKDLYSIKSDKDTNGKSISGSRKAKVIDYINNLDADYETKLILFKSEYPSDNTYNAEIVEYLNNREDVSYDEMVDILTELGFTVTDDGVVKWD